jgi:hypothetical protein
VWGRLRKGDLMSTLDRDLEEMYDRYSVELVFRIGFICFHPDPQARPIMRHILKLLARDVLAPTIPISKPTAVYLALFPNTSDEMAR